MSLYQHRLELIIALMKKGISVYFATPYGDEVDLLKELGCNYIPIDAESRGTNPFSDFKLLKNILKILKTIKPDLVLTFYTKTNIYGGLACQLTHTPYIENITGLGSALGGSGGLKQKLMINLYGLAVRKANFVFFQNSSNREFFKDHHMLVRDFGMLPGSGVALKRHKKADYPNSDNIRFVYIGRLLKQKGIFDYLDAAMTILKDHDNVEFHIVGPAEEPYIEELNSKYSHPAVIYHGKVLDVRPIIAKMHCLVFPSYYPEGMANVILESAAAGRAVITTECPGCREGVDDGSTGMIIRPHNVDDLVSAMTRFIKMTENERIEMGDRGRKKMESEFDREIVVRAYLDKIEKLLAR